MFSPVGILEPRDKSIDPPGSCLFDPLDQDENEQSVALKRDKKNHHIILQPQPSDSGRDPLNFSWLRKEIIFLVLLIGSTCTGVIGPILVPAFGTMSEQLGVPVAKIAQLNGILIMFEGVGSILLVITSAFWGRRHAYILCGLFQFVGCIWGAVAPNYNVLWGARIVQGFSMSAYAVLMGSTITDIFFVHQHGVRIALWQVSYCACVQLAPVLSGLIVTASSWRTTFWALSAFEGVVLIGLVLLCPETKTHLRDPNHLASSNSSLAEKPQTANVEEVHEVKDSLGFVESLKVFTLFRDKSVFETILAPILVLCTPHIFWSMLAYAISFSWYVFTGALYGQIYGGQYYHQSVASVGYIAGFPPLIGCLLGCALSGPLTDWSAKYLSQRNHGIFEPEFRLVVLIPSFILTAIGGYGWAFTVDPSKNILISASMGGFAFAGVTMGICAVVGYANACYPEQGGDTFAIMMLLRSAYIFGGTYFVNNWMAQKGVVNFFCIMTSVTLGIYLVGGVIWVFGKQMRLASAKWRLTRMACAKKA